MFKKLLTILLCIAMLSPVAVYAADFYSDSDSESFYAIAGLLDAVGVLDVDDNTDMATTVTKGEFIKSAVRLFLGGRQNFSNLDYTEYVELLGVDLDEITVNAGNYVTYSYAVRALLYGLGYDTLVQNDDFYSVAVQTKLLKNVTYRENQFITLEQMLKLFDNALNIRVLSMIPSGGYVKSMDDTGVLLEEVLKLQKRTGVITGTPKTCLIGKNPLKEGEIMIGDVLYKTEEEYSSYIGLEVDFYVALDTAENTLVYLYANANRNEVITLNSKDIISYRANKYVYWDDSGKKKKSVKLSTPFYVIYNGFAADDLNNSDMVPSYGSVRLIDNNGDGQYDVVDIKDYIIGKVKAVDTAKNTLYVDTVSGAKSFNLTDYDVCEIKNHNGGSIKFDNITYESIVLLMKSRKNHYIYIGKINNIVNGVLDEFSSTSGIYELTVDGKEYETAQGSIIDDKLQSGKTYGFYIDNGVVVAITGTSADKDYLTGYLINAEFDEPFNDSLLMKIFTEDGLMLLAKTAQKVKFDNQSGRDAAQVNKALCNGSNSIVPQLIRYKLDSDGNVYVIDTAYNYTKYYREAEPGDYETKDSFRVVYSSTLNDEGSVRRTNLETYSGKFILKNNYTVFQIPSLPQSASDDDFKVVKDSIAGFKNDLNTTSYSVDAFSFDGSEMYADVIVGFSKGVDSNDNCRAVITSISTTIDNDGNEVERIVLQGPPGYVLDLLNYDWVGKIPSFLNNSGERKYKYDVGDFVCVGWVGNKVSVLTMIYDMETGYYYGNGQFGYSNYHTFFKGKVYKKEGSAISVTATELTPYVTSTPADSLLYIPSTFSLRRITKVRGKTVVEKCSEQEIVDYQTSPDDCSDILIYTSSGYPWLMLIYDKDVLGGE